jgi:hypothetical protein
MKDYGLSTAPQSNISGVSRGQILIGTKLGAMLKASAEPRRRSTDEDND